MNSLVSHEPEFWRFTTWHGRAGLRFIARRPHGRASAVRPLGDSIVARGVAAAPPLKPPGHLTMAGRFASLTPRLRSVLRALSNGSEATPEAPLRGGLTRALRHALDFALAPRSGASAPRPRRAAAMARPMEWLSAWRQVARISAQTWPRAQPHPSCPPRTTVGRSCRPSGFRRRCIGRSAWST